MAALNNGLTPFGLIYTHTCVHTYTPSSWQLFTPLSLFSSKHSTPGKWPLHYWLICKHTPALGWLSVLRPDRLHWGLNLTLRPKRFSSVQKYFKGGSKETDPQSVWVSVNRCVLVCLCGIPFTKNVISSQCDERTKISYCFQGEVCVRHHVLVRWFCFFPPQAAEVCQLNLTLNLLQDDRMTYAYRHTHTHRITHTVHTVKKIK